MIVGGVDLIDPSAARAHGSDRVGVVARCTIEDTLDVLIVEVLGSVERVVDGH